MDINLFTKKFHEMELKNNLFENPVNAIIPWDQMRHDVFYLTYKKICSVNIESKYDQENAVFFTIIKNLFYNFMQFVIISTILILRSNVLVLKCSREYVSSAGAYQDSIMQPVIELLENNYFEIETNPNLKSIHHTRFIFGLPARDSSLGKINQFADELNSFINNAYNIEISTQTTILTCYKQFKNEYEFYKKLFSVTNINYVYFVQNGINKGLIKAANEKEVKVYELQHGYIGFGHPAYSYPLFNKKIANIFLPDVFLTFGSFWSKDFNYPVKKQYVIGNNKQKNAKMSKGAESRLLVISGDIYQDTLEQFTRSIAMNKDVSEIFFKLHPNQFAEYKRVKLFFQEYKHVKVILDEQNISVCLRDCYNILCIQSTVAYEAINIGRRVFCYQRLDFNVIANLKVYENFIPINSVEDFLVSWSSKEKLSLKTNLPNDIFSKFNPDIIFQIQRKTT